MNKKLQKQIKAYAGFAGALLASDKSSGQVVYVDINPDTLLVAPWLWSANMFDMNQDGQNDIQFYYSVSQNPTGNTATLRSAAIEVIGYNNNQVLKGNFLGCSNYSFFHNTPVAYPLNQGDSVPSANQINNFVQKVKMEIWQTYFYASSASNQACFFAITPLNQDDCIGVKFLVNGQFHYGWFKVGLLHKKVIIKEYAYQLQPNVPVLACDTTNLATSITDYNPQFNFSQQNNSIHISTFQKLNHANVSVYDLLGKEILQQPFVMLLFECVLSSHWNGVSGRPEVFNESVPVGIRGQPLKVLLLLIGDDVVDFFVEPL